MTKREFLRKICSTLPVIAFASPFAMGVKIKQLLQDPVDVVFTIELPRAMSLSEYKAYKKNVIEHDTWTELLGKFRAEGKILAKSYAFHSDRSVTTIQFNSLSSYHEWIFATQVHGTHDRKRLEEAGLKLSSSCSHSLLQNNLA